MIINLQMQSNKKTVLNIVKEEKKNQIFKIKINLELFEIEFKIL